MGILVQNLEFSVLTKTTHSAPVLSLFPWLNPERFFFFCLHVFICIYMPGCTHACGYGCLWLQCTCRGQRVTHRSQFSSTMWVPRIELKSLGLAPNTFTHWAMLPALEQIIFFITLLLSLTLRFKQWYKTRKAHKYWHTIVSIPGSLLSCLLYSDSYRAHSVPICLNSSKPRVKYWQHWWFSLRVRSNAVFDYSSE